ncbi:hypothetical protein [Arsenophonus nasoniae]|uniref:Uncharacterized protein n=3 Tax=Arsenophonus nasoniae TaxID=638 RepID=A0ABY8NIA2_9GAMM|nr:hypothetical protein [Arsenophonus nasoniae]WGM04168.1 hypothetical protein QE258_10890 [Arsenophonus nasoniae]
MQSTRSKNHYDDDDFKLKSEEDQTQDYGNEPFIYTASLSLEALIEWLKTELATLSDLKERLFYISGCAEHFEQQIMRLGGGLMSAFQDHFAKAQCPVYFQAPINTSRSFVQCYSIYVVPGLIRKIFRG